MMPYLFCIIIVLTISGTSNSFCPEKMLDYKETCISFNENKLTYNEAVEACMKDGGELAGTVIDFVSELNTNPNFRTLIPLPEDPSSYWARVRLENWQVTINLALFLLTEQSNCHSTLEYDEGKWSQSGCRRDAKRQFLCQFDKPKEETIPDTKHSVARKISTGMYLVGSPAFEKRVFSITFCTRTCEKASRCDSVNYNPSTGACIGFIHDITHEHENIPGWETWSFNPEFAEDCFP